MSGEVDPTQRIASPVSSGRSSPKPSKIRQRDEDSKCNEAHDHNITNEFQASSKRTKVIAVMPRPSSESSHSLTHRWKSGLIISRSWDDF